MRGSLKGEENRNDIASALGKCWHQGLIYFNCIKKKNRYNLINDNKLDLLNKKTFPVEDPRGDVG
jgi:hypothetical protein